MSGENISAGLRIDVDTLRGTKIGVPRLVSILAEHNIRATFFFSVGPDNMGRHLWRLFRPSFFLKMIRSKAASLYGWDILFKGTCWPGPIIAEKAAEQIRLAAVDHEIGLHAWDHHREQTRIDGLSEAQISRYLDRGRKRLEKIIHRKIQCTAAPSWKATESVLRAKASADLLYNSDCRGYSIFYPVIESQPLRQPQVPTTLPTYDEIVGKNGITPDNYNDHMIHLIRPARLNVLTIHAEVEGIVCSSMFSDFLHKAQRKGVRFQPLGKLLEESQIRDTSEILKSAVPGREGWVACQSQ